MAEEFEQELKAFLQARLPISASRMQSITKAALKNAKEYKLVVHGFERYRPGPDYRLPALYAIDSICRTAHKERSKARAAANSSSVGGEMDKLLGRFAVKMPNIFRLLLAREEEAAEEDTFDREKVRRILGIWEKSALFDAALLEQLEELVLGQAQEKSRTSLHGNETATVVPAEDAMEQLLAMATSSSKAADSFAHSALADPTAEPRSPVVVDPLAFDYGDSSSEDERQEPSTAAKKSLTKRKGSVSDEAIPAVHIPPPIPVAALRVRGSGSVLSPNAGHLLSPTSTEEVATAGLTAAAGSTEEGSVLASLNALKNFVSQQKQPPQEQPDNKRPRFQ